MLNSNSTRSNIYKIRTANSFQKLITRYKQQANCMFQSDAEIAYFLLPEKQTHTYHKWKQVDVLLGCSK